MKSFQACLAIFVALVGYSLAQKETPEFAKPCPRSNFNKCFMKRIESLKPYLRKGYPELGIPVVDPLFIDEIVTTQSGGPVNFKVTFRNIFVKGATNYTITDLKCHIEQAVCNMSYIMPRVTAASNFDISGKLFSLPIHGKGDGWMEMDNLDATSYLRGTIVPRGGKRYLQLDGMNVDYDVGNMRMRLNNLFGGDKVLGESMNAFLNENWRELDREARGFVVEPMFKIFKPMFQAFFDNLALEDFILEE